MNPVQLFSRLILLTLLPVALLLPAVDMAAASSSNKTDSPVFRNVGDHFSQLHLELSVSTGEPKGLEAEYPSLAAGRCDPAAWQQAEVSFRQLAEQRRQQPEAVSDQAYQAAARDYIKQGEACFQAHLPAQQEIIRFDDGGMMPPDGPELDPLFVTGGRKWGEGSPFSGGQDVSGPGLSGGTITYSYIPAGVSHMWDPSDPNQQDYNGPNTHISSLTGFSSCFYTEIETALAAWAAVANIQFVPVTEVGATPANEFPTPGNVIGHLRIGAHPFDGPYGVLAHAYYPPYYGYETGSTIPGDLHFDSGETWGCAPGAGVIDIGLVALHEFGHSIGLRHEPTALAVMNSAYNPSLSSLQPDDAAGAGAIYGSPGATYRISGYVRDAAGTGLGGVSVDFGGLRPAVGTSSSGYYEQTGFNDGLYQVSFSRSGSVFSPVLDQVMVSGGDVVHNAAWYQPVPAELPFGDDFEGGTLGSAWAVETDYEGRVRVENSYAHSGSYSLRLDDETSNSRYSHAAAILALRLALYEGVDLSFWWREFGDEDHEADGVFISDDYGTTWHRVYAFNGGSSSYTQALIDLNEQASAAGITLSDHSWIKFQFYDNYSIPSDGIAIDNVQVWPRRPDFHIQSLSAGGDTNLCAGDSLTLTTVVHNQGTEPADPSILRYSEGSSAGDFSNPLGQDRVGRLEPDQAETKVFSHTFTTPGVRYFNVRAEDGNWITEIYEDNNTAALAVTVTGDSTAPTGAISINEGADYTNTPAVTLTLTADDSGGPCPSGISDMNLDYNGSWQGWEPYSSQKSIALTGGQGTQTVAVQYRDGAANTSPVYSDTIIVDTVAPTPPALVAPADGSAGEDNSPDFSWNAVAGTELYRLQAADDDSFSGPAIDTTTVLTSYTASLLNPATYYWRVRARDAAGNWSDWSPVWSFTIDNPAGAPANDDFDTPVIFTGMPYHNDQDTTGATTAGDDPTISCAPDFSGQGWYSVWYQYTPAVTGSLTVDTFGSDFDTVLAIWTGERGSLVQQGCNDDAGSSSQSRVSLPVLVTETYYIEVVGASAVDEGQLDLAVSFQAADHEVYLPIIVRTR